ncbi:MAG: GNAT family N-acetyltransferase [Cyanosarcina radialis HA8281-LM2]|jgi:hypothetical protein|nr:GNAT family N-acetyltransferase [Cyanosarcina radialis HA8281-LM2]
MEIQIIDRDSNLWFEILQKLRHDVYHLSDYVYLESCRTETTGEAFLLVDKERIFFLPYLLRKCEDIENQTLETQENFDVISPYGYPGILLSEAAANTSGFPDLALHEMKQTFKNKKICSAFIRLHPILNSDFDRIFSSPTFTDNGQTISINLKLSDAEIWAHTRKGHQSTINKCKRLGFKARMVPFLEYIDELIEIYQETMNRVDAEAKYYFDRQYFDRLGNLGDKIHLEIVEFEEEVAAACLFFECQGIAQAHLGGTKTKFLPQSPFNLLLDYARFWAKDRGNEFLHLGGGVGGNKDKVYGFKSGFSRQKHIFKTLRLIIDEAKYHYLVDCQAKNLKIPQEELLKSNFFPAYRLANKG